jgi:fructose-specific phosphotransferase system IIC component
VRKACGTVGSFVGAMLLFRLAYGAWAPLQGDFWQWLVSDTRAQWALLAGIVGIVVGALVGQAIGAALSRD